MFKRFTLSVVIFFLAIQASGQEICKLTIRGKVVHAENNEPIEGAYIWLIEAEVGAVTDVMGNFRIQKVCTGKQTIKVQYIGHQEHIEKLNIQSNVNLTIRLVAEELQLEGVEIHGHEDALLTTNTVLGIFGEELRISRGQSLGETLKRIPGVTSFSSGSSIQKPVIHGLHSNRILILNNGVRLEGQQWGADHAPEIDPFVAREISVVKGAETVRFGPDAMGGVILVNPAPLPTKGGQSGEIDLIGFTNGRGINGSVGLLGGSEKIKGLGYWIQASSKIAGNLQTPNYLLDNTGVRELNFSGAMGYSNSRLGTELYFSHFQTTIGILTDAHTGNLSDLESIIANGRPFREPDFSYSIQNPQQNVDHQLLKLKAHYHLADGAKLNIQYAFQRNHRQEFDRRRGELNGRPSLDLVLFTNTLDLSYNHHTRKNWNGAVGLQLIQQANSNIPGTGVVPLIPNYDMLNVGVFAIEKYTAGPLEIEGGLRYDFRQVSAARINRGGVLQEGAFEFNNFSAFIGALYPISRTLTFNTNLGTAWRPPSINEQFSQGLHHGLAAIEIGNPDFVSEQSFKWMNTLNYVDSKLNIELTGFANRINNYIYLNPTEEKFVSLRGTFNVFEYLQTNAFFFGSDLSAVLAVNTHWEVFSRGSIVMARNTSENTFLPFIPPNRLETGLSYNFQGNISKNETKISFSNLAVARQNREPVFDLAPAPPAYTVWNLGLQSGLDVGKNKLNIGVQITNLFDKEYKDYMNRFRYFSHELGRNIFLKLNYEF